MVSFIIAAYNCEKYISKCIQSILRQDYQAFEIIVINDGSTDTTRIILEDYTKQDARIKLFNVYNGGPSRARNIGLDNASGEWVIFVDADDWIEHDMLSKLDITDNSSPDIIFWGFNRCYENGQLEVCSPQTLNLVVDQESVYNLLAYLLDSEEEFFGYSWNKLFKRSIIENTNLRFCDGLHCREDELFTLMYCSHISSLSITSLPLYNYRMITTSLSHSESIKFKNYRLLATKERECLSSIQHSSFHDMLVLRIFKYYVASISECMHLKHKELYGVINDAVLFYDKHYKYLDIPRWQSVIFKFPITSIRTKLIYFIFQLRIILKNKR